MFKRERIKGFIFGVVLTLTLVGSVGAFAVEQASAKIEVFYSSIKLVVDGQTVKFGKDSAGNQIEPFVYNGTTYLPVRAVGESLGKNVDWDGSTKTVYLGKRTDASNYLLNYIKPYDVGRYYWSFGETSENQLGGKYSMTMGGNKYYNGFKFGDPCHATFNLNGQVTEISGIIGLDDYENDENTNINFIGDGKLLKTINLEANALPQNFSVNVSGVLQLKIEKGAGYSEVDFAQVIFK